MPERSPETELYVEAVNALRRKVCGWTLKESKKTYVYEEGKRRVKDVIQTQKNVGPDLAAIQFVLAHLRPGLWNKPAERDDHADETEKPDLSRLSEEALNELNRLCEK